MMAASNTNPKKKLLRRVPPRFRERVGAMFRAAEQCLADHFAKVANQAELREKDKKGEGTTWWDLYLSEAWDAGVMNFLGMSNWESDDLLMWSHPIIESGAVMNTTLAYEAQIATDRARLEIVGLSIDDSDNEGDDEGPELEHDASRESCFRGTIVECSFCEARQDGALLHGTNLAICSDCAGAAYAVSKGY